MASEYRVYRLVDMAVHEEIFTLFVIFGKAVLEPPRQMQGIWAAVKQDMSAATCNSTS